MILNTLSPTAWMWTSLLIEDFRTLGYNECRGLGYNECRGCRYYNDVGRFTTVAVPCWRNIEHLGHNFQKGIKWEFRGFHNSCML